MRARALFVLVPALGSLAALGSWPAPAPAATAAAAPARAQATTLDLGAAVCGECCTTRILGALGNLPGVRDVDARIGTAHVVVHHAATADPRRFVAALVAAGWSGAAIAAVPVESTERRWCRPKGP